MRRAIIGVSAVLGALASAAYAYAGNGASISGYFGSGGNVQHAVQSHGTLAATAQSGTLPFTGLSLGLIVGAALLLVAVGVVMRRAGRRKTQQ